MMEVLQRIDRDLLLWVNGHHSPFFDKMMFLISGRAEWIPLYAVVLAFIIWKFRWNSLWIILSVVVMITLSDQVANLLKSGVQRPRPCKDAEIGHLVHLVNSYCSGAYGFVSGHAANSFALATFISLLFRKKWIVSAMFLWAALVSYSRIYLGVHYPGDIMGGAIVGILLAWLIFTLLNRFLPLTHSADFLLHQGEANEGTDAPAGQTTQQPY
jgi:undecaprenyl-diphosphatase